MLEGANVIRKDPLSRRYEIGSAFETMALDAIRHGGGHCRRRLLMQRLAEKIGERINLGVLSRGRVLYVEWVESASPLRVDLQPGTYVPAHCSANGKLLLAYSPPEVRQQILGAEPYPSYTPATITRARALARELELTRQRGWAEDNEEFLAGVCCLAVPVFNRRGEAVAGLAVMAPTARLSLERARGCIPALRACADTIAADLERTDVEPPLSHPRLQGSDVGLRPEGRVQIAVARRPNAPPERTRKRRVR